MTGKWFGYAILSDGYGCDYREYASEATLRQEVLNDGGSLVEIWQCNDPFLFF
jgi:hypothetical protein